MRRLLLKLFRRRRLEEELEAELAFHREMSAANGNPIPLGNPAVLKEQARDLWRFTWIENLWRDLRYAARSLRRSPALVLSALLSLGLGIGVNTAIFSLVNEFLLSVPSLEDPASWVRIRVGGNSHSLPAVVEAFQAGGAFSAVVGEREQSSLNWDNGAQTKPVFAIETTPNYFTELGVPIAIGRGYQPSDPQEVVVLSHRFWQERLGGNPGIVGQSLRLGGRACIVTGVLPARHRTLVGFGFSPDLYAPAREPETALAVYARLPEGVTLAEAHARAMTIAARLEREGDPHRYTQHLRVIPLGGTARLTSQNTGAMIQFAVVLLAVVGLVLLIACVNVTGLLLARAAARRQETSIRLSLGASRGRLVQQLLAEGLLLSLLALLSGLVVRHALALLLENVRLPLPVPVRFQLELTWRVAAYAGLLVLFTSIATGLLPAWQAARESLAAGVRREGRLRLRRGLVVAQVTISFLVLATSFLFLHNLLRSQALSPGFDVAHTVRADVHLPYAKYQGLEPRRVFFSEALTALQALPGVESAAAARLIPFTDGITNRSSFTFQDTGEKAEGRYHWNAVTPDYFRTMGIAVVQGSSFTSASGTATIPVIVNRAWVDRFAQSAPAVGRSFRVDLSPTPRVIVGVVEGTKTMTIGEEPQPQLYEELARVQDGVLRMQFVVRSELPPTAQVDAVRSALRRLEPGAGLEVEPLSASVGLAFLPSQIGAALLGSLGVLALALAGVGLYGVMAYAVVRRTREIGVRMAVGASSRAIARLVLTEAAWLVGVGSLIGLAVALVITQPLTTFLVPGLHPRDPASLMGVLLVLTAVGLLAAVAPLRRALRIDPWISLRHE